MQKRIPKFWSRVCKIKFLSRVCQFEKPENKKIKVCEIKHSINRNPQENSAIQPAAYMPEEGN